MSCCKRKLVPWYVSLGNREFDQDLYNQVAKYPILAALTFKYKGWSYTEEEQQYMLKMDELKEITFSCRECGYICYNGSLCTQCGGNGYRDRSDKYPSLIEERMCDKFVRSNHKKYLSCSYHGVLLSNQL